MTQDIPYSRKQINSCCDVGHHLIVINLFTLYIKFDIIDSSNETKRYKMKDLIETELNRLKEINYRTGFNDSVLSHICEVLDPVDSRKLWNKICCGSHTYIAETYGQDTQDLYDEVTTMSNGEGCFVMASWGTRGT